MLRSFSDAGPAIAEVFVKAFRTDERLVLVDGGTPNALTLHMDQNLPQRRVVVRGGESSLVLTAAGLALEGFIPLVGVGVPRMIPRAYDEIRAGVALPRLPVLLLGDGGGLRQEEYGAPCQVVEDLALMRALPGMRVLVPSELSDLVEILTLRHEGPAYLRLGRFIPEDVRGAADRSDSPKAAPFWGPRREDVQAGGRIRRPGSHVTICSCGALVQEALRAAEILASQGIDAEVVECLSIKPLPENLILASGRRTGCCVVAEEHSVVGGLGSAIAELTGRCYPVPVLFVAIEDQFGQSGTADELLDYYALTRQQIVGAAVQAWGMRRGI